MGTIEKWQQPARILFDSVYDILKENVEDLVDRHFAHMGRGGAKQTVLCVAHFCLDPVLFVSRMIVLDHLEAAAAQTKSKIEWLLKLEKEPATFNTHYYSSYKDKFLAHYKAGRDLNSPASTTKTPHDREMKNAIAALATIGYNVTPDDLSKLLPPDPTEAALGIMASVRAYFQGS